MHSSSERFFDARLRHALTPRDLGRLGEVLAGELLESDGYELVARNYRCPEGEADIIAFDPLEGETVLVEVKTRRMHRSDHDLFPEEFVTHEKVARYRRIAGRCARGSFATPRVRFDVIGVRVFPDRTVELLHCFDVFSWEAGR